MPTEENLYQKLIRLNPKREPEMKAYLFTKGFSNDTIRRHKKGKTQLHAMHIIAINEMVGKLNLITE